LRTVTIIQARTGSSRLPAKALMPVAGYPSAILATLRAANQRRETVLATSDDRGDDDLADQARSHGINVFRGPLDDVLARYYLASSSFAEDCAVVRLTADNVLPDGKFVDELAKAFESAGTDYLNTDSSVSGLPYGLGGEVFSVAALRKAYRHATSAADREHVGPWIRRNCSSSVYRPQRVEDSHIHDAGHLEDLNYLRCTIDDREDYERIVRLFADVSDPLHISWQDLLLRLTRLPGEAAFGVPYRMISGRRHSELTLGTAQLGMEYGALNDHGKPLIGQAVAIVRKAISHGVAAIDTARSYGTAEQVLGKALTGAWASRVEVITKLDLSDLPADASAVEVRERVDEGVRLSCESLGVTRLAVLLLHRWQDRRSWHGAAWQHLLDLRDGGKIGVLGASVYQPGEALEALDDPAIGHLQIPINVLDWRWEEEHVDLAATSRPEVVVHARSVLLQGVLAHPANRWPSVEDFDTQECWQTLTRLSREFGCESATDLCLRYVRSLPWVTSAVVGCETIEQLEENLRLCCNAKLTAEQRKRLREELPHAPEALLNPSKWKVHEHSAVQ
jgi:spore coat polysaccharide biosynthesis protein SpsF (cytidylyltransferase family)/aryl-alcohol dehydrogenase-like predicted oxidoreductase